MQVNLSIIPWLSHTYRNLPTLNLGRCNMRKTELVSDKVSDIVGLRCNPHNLEDPFGAVVQHHICLPQVTGATCTAISAQ